MPALASLIFVPAIDPERSSTIMMSSGLPPHGEHAWECTVSWIVLIQCHAGWNLRRIGADLSSHWYLRSPSLHGHATNPRRWASGWHSALRDTTLSRLVVIGGMRLVLAGAAIGLVGAWGVTRLMQSLLYEVAPGDPLTFAVVTGLLSGAALLACYVPAMRAARIDPMSALHYE